MSGVWTKVQDYWNELEKLSDPRVKGWFLFDTPLPTLYIVLTYLLFVLVIGPKFMANRKPYNAQKALILYNIFQIVLSAYMFYEHLMSGWWGEYSLLCQPVDYSDSETSRRMLQLCWVYHFSKLTEFADTVFFILRKKPNQMSWLHVYHHSLTPFLTYILVKFVPGGQASMSNIVNNFVHTVMYTYYLIAALGPQYEKYLRWKKCITILQIVQFFLVSANAASVLIYDCGFSKIIAALLILNNAVFCGFFANFYYHAYKKEPIRNLQEPKYYEDNILGKEKVQ